MKTIVIIFTILFACSAKTKYCRATFTIYQWNMMTKSRVDKAQIKSSESNFKRVQLNQDSLLQKISYLIPTKDTLYNIRLYCKFEQDKKELYIDKTGIIEYDSKCYARNDDFIKFILNSIPFEDKSRYWPLWLDKK